MIERLLFWLDKGFLHFGIAKSLSDKLSGDFFAIVDGNEELNNFYKNQKLVPFQGIWNYQENTMITNNQPDLFYLQNFEKQYKIDIWKIAYTERKFYPRYHKYYKFNSDEILSIIEKECKFYEKVLDECQPQFLLINTITHHHHLLLYLMCKYKGIKTLTLEATRLASRSIVVDEMNKRFEINIKVKTNHTNLQSSDELRTYLRKRSTYKYGSEYQKRKDTSRYEKFFALLHFLFVLDDEHHKKHYFEYGRTKLNVLRKGLATIHKLRTKRRENFINKNLSRSVNTETPFIYFPLHIEPERSLLIDAPLYTNQIALIENIAKSIPVGYSLYVKEHPSMNHLGWRHPDYYKQILNLPNVQLIHPSAKNDELLEKCSLVIAVTGSSSFEAAFFGKPSIIFEDASFSNLPSVNNIQSLDELSKAIRFSLQKKVDLSILGSYLDGMEKNTFEFDAASFNTDWHNRFYRAGYLKELSLSEPEIKSFLEDHKAEFNIFALKHLEQIEILKDTIETEKKSHQIR